MEAEKQHENSSEGTVIKEVEKRKAEWLQPYAFKKGQSGNPGGRPAGKSLKQYAKDMLAAMSEEERQEYLQGIDKKTIWEMAEGKPKQDTEIKGNLTISQVLDALENE